MGWSDFESDAEHQALENKQAEQDAATLHALFGSELGQRGLEIIRRRTEAVSTLPAQSVDGQAMALLMAVREGENNLYRWITSMTKKGHPNATRINHRPEQSASRQPLGD